MTDRYNAELDPQIDLGDMDDYERQTTQAIYDRGIEAFRTSGYYFERDLFGPYMHHNVYVIERPQAIEGITYPNTFRVKRPIYSTQHFEEIQAIIHDIGESNAEFGKFWVFFGQPDVSQRKPPYGFVKQLIQADQAGRKNDPSLPFDFEISFDCAEGSGLAKSWLPPREWFNESLYDVELKDVLTIFPEAERELLGLLIGRTVVGRSNHLPVNHEEAIKHTARMCACIIGLDPGTGKSTFFGYMNDALGKVGYTQSTFRNLGDRFNLGSVVSAHWAYKDDVTSKTFKQFLGSEYAKIIVTGGILRVEEKGVNAIDVYPNCTLFLNSNSFDPRLVYDIDPGTADRVKFLRTLSNVQIASIMPTGVSEGSPNLKPFVHLPWLAENLGVSLDALILWVIRLCADEFLRLITDDSDPSVNALEERVRMLTSHCQITISKDTNRQILLWFMFCSMLSSSVTRKPRSNRFTGFPVRQTSSNPWDTIIDHTINVAKHKPLRDRLYVFLKEDWENKGFPASHPFMGMDLLDHNSLPMAAKVFGLESGPGVTKSIAEVLKVTLGKILLKSGFHLTSDYVWFCQEWSQAYEIVDEISDLAEAFIEDNEELLESTAWTANTM
ncbi:putative DNA primase [Acaryochloris phage A-HIS2]|nr:putative DNA primase [Acaryochloris phage A-HIS2]